MGYHQSRWGYNSSQKLLQILQSFSDYNLPIDTIFSDIDYMNPVLIYSYIYIYNQHYYYRYTQISRSKVLLK